MDEAGRSVAVKGARFASFSFILGLVLLRVSVVESLLYFSSFMVAVVIVSNCSSFVVYILSSAEGKKCVLKGWMY